MLLKFYIYLYDFVMNSYQIVSVNIHDKLIYKISVGNLDPVGRNVLKTSDKQTD
jgi:hypothetical protein